MPSLTNIISPPASPLLSLIGFNKSSSTTNNNNTTSTTSNQSSNNPTTTTTTCHNTNNTKEATSSQQSNNSNLELSDISDHNGFVTVSPTLSDDSSALSSNSSLILGSSSTPGWLSSGSGAHLMTPLTSWFQLSNITTPLTDNIKNVSDNIKSVRTFVTSTLKGALSLTSTSGSLKGKTNEGFNDFVFVEHDDSNESPVNNIQKTSSQETLIQISLCNLTEYSNTLSPLFYNDELLPMEEYKQFLIDYSEKVNTFLTKYFKMEPNIGVNSKNLLELYDHCSLITRDQQSKYSQNIEKCIQKLIFEIIAVDGTFNIHHEKDSRLYKKLKLFQNVLEPKHISLPNDFYKTEEVAWNECVHLLRKLNQYKTPYGKIYIVEKVFKRVSEICSKVDRAFSSDHLLSCLIYLVLKACPHNLNSDMWFLVTFCLDGIYRNEGSELDFLLTTMYCALEFWENVPSFDQTELSDEKIFKSFIVDEQEKTKFKKAFKMARRKTQTLEKIIIEHSAYSSKN